jgi:hypothetical protein
MKCRIINQIIYIFIALIVLSNIFSGQISIEAYEYNDPPFWMGEVTLVENSYIKITANNSGITYNVSATSSLGALDAASKLGEFEYIVNDVWYDSFGLLVESISDRASEGWDGWQYWINYPDEEIPMISADSYELNNNNILDWFYGGYDINPDTTSMLIKINVRIISDDTNPEISLIKPTTGCLYIFDNKIINLPIESTIIFGKINLNIEASDEITSIKKIEIYIGEILIDTLNFEPYTWLWEKSSFGKQNLKIIAYDQVDNHKSVELNVFKFSF